MTLLEHIEEVGSLLNMQITNTSTVTKDQVVKNLNRGKDFVFNRLISLGQTFNTRAARADIKEGQAHYSLPKDFRKFVTLKIGYRDKKHRVKAKELDVMSADYFNPTEDLPCYIELGNIIEIKPIPEQNVAEGLYFYYIEHLPDMQDDIDTDGLPLGYDSLLAIYAAYKCKISLGLIQEAGDLYKIFQKELDEMSENISERNIDAPDMLVNLDPY